MHPTRSELSRVRSRARSARAVRGFTLIEMVVALVLMAVLATVTAPLLRLPMSAYFDTASRAGLSDDIALANSKFTADFERAVPGTARQRQAGAGAQHFVEFLQQRARGRYRADAASAPAASVCQAVAGCNGPVAERDVLDAGGNDNCFASIGPWLAAPAAGVPTPNADQVVIGPTADTVYLAGNASGRSALLETRTDPASGASCLRTQPAVFQGSASRAFYVVDTPVTYQCNTATGRLTRHWGYAIAANQPTVFGAAVPSAVLAEQVVACRMQVVGTGDDQLVVIWLRLSSVAGGGLPPEFAETTLQFRLRDSR